MVQDCILFNSLLVLWLHSFQLYTATKHLSNGTGYILSFLQRLSFQGMLTVGEITLLLFKSK